MALVALEECDGGGRGVIVMVPRMTGSGRFFWTGAAAFTLAFAARSACGAALPPERGEGGTLLEGEPLGEGDAGSPGEMSMC